MSRRTRRARNDRDVKALREKRYQEQQAEEAIQRLAVLAKLERAPRVGPMTWPELQARFPALPPDGAIVSVDGTPMSLKECADAGMVTVGRGGDIMVMTPFRGGSASSIYISPAPTPGINT